MRVCVCVSYEVNGVHTTGERYRYELGVCTDVGSTPHYEGCGTMQFGLSNPNLTHCLGKLSMSQVARSESECGNGWGRGVAN